MAFSEELGGFSKIGGGKGMVKLACPPREAGHWRGALSLRDVYFGIKERSNEKRL